MKNKKIGKPATTNSIMPIEPATVINKKIQVYRVIPEKLKIAIDDLGLSKIMKNKALKLVCLLIQKGMQNNHDLSGYISLAVNYLQKTFTPYYHTDFFNLLKSEKIIESNEKYKQGSKAFPGYSKGYRINEHLLNGEFVSTSYQDDKFRNDQDSYININRRYFYKNLNNNHTNVIPTNSITNHLPSINMHISTKLFEKSMIFEDLSSLFYDEEKIWKATEAKIAYISTKLFKVDNEITQNYFEVINHINDLTYKTTKKKAIAWSEDNGVTLIQDGKFFYMDDLDRYVLLKKRNLLLNYKWYIAKLKKNIFYANRNVTNNRLDHNLTSLNKDTMKIIKKDNDLIEIDMKNCQFAIHAYWMKQKDLCVDEDVQKYYNMCSKGTLYEELAKIMNVTREEAKQVMMEVAFTSEDYRSPAKKLFKGLFPNVVAHIDGFKKEKKDSSLFSVELQELESEIFVDNLYPNIKELGLFCLTKHDSLIVKRADEDQVVELIRAYFKYLDLECVLDIEGRSVHICSDNIVPENGHSRVLEAQIQDQTEIVIEDKPEAESMTERQQYQYEFETTYFPDLGDKPEWWQSLEYFKENYGEEGAIELYEGQTRFIGKF